MAKAFKSGYDAETDACDERFVCPICHCVFRSPRQTLCGHRFCVVCIEEHFRHSLGQAYEDKSSHQVPCPSCRKPVAPSQIFADLAFSKEIQSLRVGCKNDGCDWKGEIRKYDEHQQVCSLVPEVCAKCNDEIARCEMQEHWKICRPKVIRCFACGKSYPRNQDHKGVCPRKVIQCPNGCGTKIARQEVDHHCNTSCPREIIDCPYQRYGCTWSGNRAHENIHLDNQKLSHLLLVNTKFEKLQDELDKSQQQTALNGGIIVDRENQISCQNEIIEEKYEELEEQENEIKDLEESLSQKKSEISELERKMNEMKSTINVLRDSERQLKEENVLLKQHQLPWWRRSNSLSRSLPN